jgi:esterase
MLVHEQVGAPDAPKVGWFLHGILGRGRNWRTLARKLAASAPDHRFLLVDLRGHGESPAPPPNDLAACAADLDELAAREGVPSVVIGHSFGGKVVMSYLRDRAPAGVVGFVLDAIPGPMRQTAFPSNSDPVSILNVLRSMPTFAPTRDALRQPLNVAGIPGSVVDWLLTSATETPDGWRFVWDLPVIDALLASYAQADFWPWLEQATHEVHLVRAGRSDRWTPQDVARLEALRPPAVAHLLPTAGHWLHVDDPAGTLGIIAPSLGG